MNGGMEFTTQLIGSLLLESGVNLIMTTLGLLDTIAV
jgi:hypothetical protein